jgi:hypothetical protein
VKAVINKFCSLGQIPFSSKSLLYNDINLLFVLFEYKKRKKRIKKKRIKKKKNILTDFEIISSYKV